MYEIPMVVSSNQTEKEITPGESAVSLQEEVSSTKVRAPVTVVDNGVSIALGLGAAYSMSGGVPYTGATTVTPTQETQVLETDGKTIDGNITVNPIPSNYGLITWNGSILTVS